MIKFAKVRGRMAERGMTMTHLSELSGIPVSTLSNKLSGQTEFKTSEIVAVAKALEIPSIEKYFFG